ncbi:MAG TPA: hypothetical protein VMR19_02915 [Candidatus Saccharimonadales bacterium]|jgi:hypothetical protein|nr:hypothetical protein [Candidatus Saccharimonadales bacterium]
MNLERIGNSEIQISEAEFEHILPKICDAEISYDPEGWTFNNPLYGTCVPVSLVAKKIFGGSLLRADLKDLPRYRHMEFHWVNLLNGRIMDFTRAQFGEEYPEGMEYVRKSPSSILRHTDVARRTCLLYQRLLGEMKDSQILGALTVW